MLVPGGVLIDLRPQMDRWPVEVAAGGGYQTAGRVNDLETPLADDRAADQAILEAGNRGWFHRDPAIGDGQSETFPIFYYWDSPAEMQEYIQENWDDIIVMDDLWKALSSLWVSAGPDARPRIRLKMMITRWLKGKS